MKAITVRQPWAWAIFHGKDVENRRRWAYKHRGLTALHAGVHIAGGGAFGEVDRLAEDVMPVLGGPSAPVDVAMGAVIGVVDLVDVHWWEDCHTDDGRLCSTWAEHGTHHLILRHARPLTAAVEYPGKLGVWDLPGRESRTVMAAAA